MILHLLARPYYSGKLVGVLWLQISVPPLIHNSETRWGVVLPITVRLGNSRGVVLPITVRLGHLSEVYLSITVRLGNSLGIVLPTVRLGRSSGLISAQLFEIVRLGKTRQSLYYRKVAMTLELLGGFKIANVFSGLYGSETRVALKFYDLKSHLFARLHDMFSPAVVESCEWTLVLSTIQLGNYSGALHLYSWISHCTTRWTIRKSVRCYQDWTKPRVFIRSFWGQATYFWNTCGISFSWN